MYDEAIKMLQLATEPTKLPCWDKEKEYIWQFLDTGIASKGSASSLYISGMPGTGKTATTFEILK